MPSFVKSLRVLCSNWSTAEHIKSLNGWLTWFWVANIPPFVLLYLVLDTGAFQAFCLFYLGIVSILALVGSHFSGWVSGRAEVKIDQSENH